MFGENMLSRTDLFRGIEVSSLERLCAQGSEKHLEAGEILFLEGAQGQAFYLLEQGTIRLSKTGMGGQEVTVRLVQRGEIFAEVILFENPAYPVNAVAVVASAVLAISRTVFLTLLDEREFRNRFIANIMRKQRYLTERILYLTSLDVEERFFRFLLERYGRQSTYTIDLPKKDISAAIGTIPETFSRLIQRLKQQNLLEWEGSQVRISPEVWELYAQ